VRCWLRCRQLHLSRDRSERSCGLLCDSRRVLKLGRCQALRSIDSPRGCSELGELDLTGCHSLTFAGEPAHSFRTHFGQSGNVNMTDDCFSACM